jgi:adenine-specific DNA-methyltransferase
MKNTTTDNMQKVKDDLIAEIDKRIADKIIEKTNADLLKKLIEQAETVNEAIMIAELGTTYRRTGFHFDKRLEKMTDTIKYFKKNKKLSFVQDKNALTHKLIVGDNYDALLNLLIEYRGRIDVIYIDPPYGKDSMGEFAQTNYENAITRDNLLSMLFPRLVLARQLLSDTGVIFCSIDDKNQAYVKGLFDEIFGESNFAGSLPRTTTTKGKNDEQQVATSHDYVIIYSKIDTFTRNNDFLSLKRYKLEDERGKYYAEATLDSVSLPYSESLDFTIKFNNKDFEPIIYNGKKTSWRWSKDLVDFGIKNDLIIDKNGRLYTKTYLNYEIEKKNGEYLIVEKEVGGTHRSLMLLDYKYSNNEASRILKELNITFDYSKPTDLIKKLILLIPYSDNSTILDFFAGSGTTGQAVLELNKQDGGQRQFILATANEITDTTSNGIVNDVTSKRLKRVMTGECYDGTKNFKWNEKNKPLGDNLDVYDIATVAPYSNEPFEKIDETLYGKEKLGVKEKIKWVCENFEGTQKTLTDK